MGVTDKQAEALKEAFSQEETVRAFGALIDDLTEKYKNKLYVRGAHDLGNHSLLLLVSGGACQMSEDIKSEIDGIYNQSQKE